MVHPLRRLGVTLVTPEIPGYTHGSVSRSARWQDWVSAATASVEALVAASPGPCLLGGLCTGAVLALAVAAKHRLPSIRGLALLSPLLSYDGWALPWWYRLRHLAYGLGLADCFAMREQPPYGLKDERMRQMVRRQMESEQATLVGPAQVSLRVIRESERLSNQVIPVLADLALPVLALHAREDEICSLGSVQSALATISPGLLRTVVLENSYHMITADNDRQQVARELATFCASALVPSRPLPTPGRWARSEPTCEA